MTLSREAQRRKEWLERHQLGVDTSPVPGVQAIPEQRQRLTDLCIVDGCVRPRQRGQLCQPHDVETDP